MRGGLTQGTYGGRGVAGCGCISVLLVDDDLFFREALAENLRADGHTVIECASAERALPVMRTESCVVLIAEYALSGVNGVRLADEFRSARSGPTLLVTAQESGAVTAHVRIRSYVELLAKPVAYDELHDRLHEVVRAARDS